MQNKLETVSATLGAVAGEVVFMSQESIVRYQQLGYEAKGVGSALLGMVALGGLAAYLRGRFNRQPGLTEEVESIPTNSF